MLRSNSVAIHVGSLLEIRADAGYRTANDVDTVFDAIDVEVAKLPAPPKYTTVVDWRRCPVMSPDAAARIGFRICQSNTRVVRSAALASEEAPIAILQFVRLIREAGNPCRRLFFHASELVDWLGEVLAIDEIARLRSFLA